MVKRKDKDRQFDLPVGPTKGTPKRTKVEEEQMNHPGKLHNTVVQVLSATPWMTADEVHAEVHRLRQEPIKFKSLKATIRNLRKPQFGGHQVLTRRVCGQFQYKLVLR